MTIGMRFRLFLIIVALAAASHRGDAASAPDGAAAAAGWTTVATFNGDGGPAYDTKAFAVHGRKVRVVFTVQPNSSGPVPLLLTLFREGTSGVKNELGRETCVSCDGPQTKELGIVRAGNCYLHVITSRPWTVTVEEAQ